MAGTDDYLRLVLNLAAEEGAFLDPVGRAEDAELNAMGTASVTSPAVSLMITNRQRVALRELGISEESIRQMTPAEAHGKLGLA
ncbi:hypothetical protein MKK67_14240 [Methylobacterium sp. J-072]|uniref:hypothetical protein n=1 Tax=Methylobacterium sp. J-072 TaxID=2836651 RepID=UPI001FBBE0CA|nr:hypothetical protein [Methylobacterium sp. J-072]MCJ2093639.1 hypothetical protein [Methylobacterium sp. J-072]